MLSDKELDRLTLPAIRTERVDDILARVPDLVAEVRDLRARIDAALTCEDCADVHEVREHLDPEEDR